MTSSIGLFLLAMLSIGASAAINLLSNDPLIEAVKADDLKGAEEMLQRQHDVDARDENGQTALFFAAIRGNEDFVEMLLRFNPKIGAVDKFGSSPLNTQPRRIMSASSRSSRKRVPISINRTARD